MPAKLSDLTKITTIFNHGPFIEKAILLTTSAAGQVDQHLVPNASYQEKSLVSKSVNNGAMTQLGLIAFKLPKENLMTDPTHYLFVYGTLTRRYNNPYAANLQEGATYVSEGKINGLLYHLEHYPGAVLSDVADCWVNGEIDHLLNNQTLLHMLAEYEGYTEAFPGLSKFIRVKAPVLTPADGWLQCWVYLYNGGVENRTPIEKW